MNQIIPDFAQKLLKREIEVHTLQSLGDAAHKMGINHRFMGKVYLLIKHVSVLLSFFFFK
jgi:hypothetical protein